MYAFINYTKNDEKCLVIAGEKFYEGFIGKFCKHDLLNYVSKSFIIDTH